MLFLVVLSCCSHDGKFKSLQYKCRTTVAWVQSGIKSNNLPVPTTLISERRCESDPIGETIFAEKLYKETAQQVCQQQAQRMLKKAASGNKMLLFLLRRKCLCCDSNPEHLLETASELKNIGDSWNGE